jgi:SAM-dependent methyltransferase
MLFPGARVIDIGCGVGKYGTYLAELGYDVTLTDISGEMLRHAGENMAKYSTPWAVYRCDFNEATGKEPVFADGFDLAISTMSPAIHDAETVKKMSAMTRGWCFLARFYDWEQPFRDQLMKELGLVPRRAFDDLHADCASMIRAVSAAGYVPLTRYVDYNWADPRTPEQMADYMGRTYFVGDENREELIQKTLRLAERHAGADGNVIDNVNTRVAWIYWRTGEHP